MIHILNKQTILYRMDKNLHTMEELKTKVYGKIGTPKRDEIEKKLKVFRVKTKQEQEKELTN